MGQPDVFQHTIKIDDRNPSIFYSNNTWSLGGGQNDYLGTTTRSNKVGAFLRIPFIGTKITIFGTIDSATSGGAPVSTFTIDDDCAQEILQQQTGSIQYQQKLYESPDLCHGPHTLLVTILSVPSTEAFFTFDWAEFLTDPTLSCSAADDMVAKKATQTFRASQNVKQDVQTVIRLNDRDTTISYSADTWFFEENISEYLATSTRTTRPGASIIIPFTGTKIVTFGTIGYVDCGKSPMAVFSLDGGHGNLMSFQRQTEMVQYQQKLYESPDLEPGPHVLVVTVASVPNAGVPFIFDYAEYYPCDTLPFCSPSGFVWTGDTSGQPSVDLLLHCDRHSKAGQPMFKIDDRDPIISYSSNTWSLGGNGNEYLGTTTRTHLAGASMRIPFIGTKIMIFGTIDSIQMGESPVSLFIIDGGLHAQEFVQKQTDEFQWQQKFYESPSLSSGSHVLEVIIISAPSTRAHFTFDYAQYFPFDAITQPSILSINSTKPDQDAHTDMQMSTSELEPSISSKGTPISAQSSGTTKTENYINDEIAAMTIGKCNSTRTEELHQVGPQRHDNMQYDNSDLSLSTIQTSASAHSLSSTSEEWWQISEASGSGPMTTTLALNSESTLESEAAASIMTSVLPSFGDAVDPLVSLDSSVSTAKVNKPHLAKPVSRVRGFLFRG